MEAQIKKGILEMCVLFSIRDKELYGYDVMRQMGKYFPEVHESTFYVILRRLHAEGSADITLSQDSNGPTRKYYRITGAGREVLRVSIEQWKRIRTIVDDMGLEQE